MKLLSWEVENIDKINIGTFKGNKGKVKECYRKKWSIHIEKISKTKVNGAPYDINIHPSNVCITKIKLAGDR